MIAGLGVLYNLEHVAVWLQQLEVPFLVRSHECIEEGDIGYVRAHG